MGYETSACHGRTHTDVCVVSFVWKCALTPVEGDVLDDHRHLCRGGGGCVR